MAITGYYLGTVNGGESKFGTQKLFIVLNKCCVNKSCDMSHGHFFFFLRKILNN